MRRLLLLALCAAPLSGCVSVNKGNRPLGSIVGQSETTPQPGEWCRVTYPEQRAGWTGKSQTQLTGQVESVDEEGIQLRDVVIEGRTQSAPLVQKIPYVNRYFKNTGVGMESAGSYTVKPGEFERLEIISEHEAKFAASHLLARNLVAAIPGPQRP